MGIRKNALMLSDKAKMFVLNDNNWKMLEICEKHEKEGKTFKENIAFMHFIRKAKKEIGYSENYVSYEVYQSLIKLRDMLKDL